uniref:Nucleolar protein 12 n=1 Tax=Xenopsylla cheopis TaxID=163159 RepID=A0A6M2DIF5_XENCH
MGKGKQTGKPRRKINLVFNEEKRREFLQGFHKRKLQRKKKAQEELQMQLKDERRRLKQEARESYKKLVTSHKPIPELEKLLEKEYETEDVSVKVVELSIDNIAKSKNLIGSNFPHYEVDASIEEDVDEEAKPEEIPGMELKYKPELKKKPNESSNTTFNTKKDIKRELRKKATKNVQKSKAFQIKSKLERQRNKKMSSKKKSQKMKLHSKRAKHKGKKINNE